MKLLIKIKATLKHSLIPIGPEAVATSGFWRLIN